MVMDEVVAILAQTPGTLQGLLEGLPEALLTHRKAEGTFSPRDVLGHLIHGEKTDWVPRIELILRSGDTQPFVPFDRTGFQDEAKARTTTELLHEFRSLRSANLELLRRLSLSAAQLSLPGRHPELGPVTLGQLLATWAVHDLNHIVQVARVIGSRYSTAVGPWRAYLGILNS